VYAVLTILTESYQEFDSVAADQMFLCPDAVCVSHSTTESEHARQYVHEGYVPNLPQLALDPSVRDGLHEIELESAIGLPPHPAVTATRCRRWTPFCAEALVQN
jgi:hypothetical protein